MDTKKFLIATLAGGLVLFAYGMSSWMVLPFHTATVKRVVEEDAFSEILMENLSEEGVYVVPGFPDEEPVDWEAFTARHEKGPIASIYYSPTGGTPMGPGMMGIGLVMQLVSAGITAWILAMTALPSYGKRVALVAVLGILIAIQSDFMYWNWMWFPFEYTLAMAFDDVLGWLLVGLLQAKIITPVTAESIGSAGDRNIGQ